MFVLIIARCPARAHVPHPGTAPVQRLVMSLGVSLALGRTRFGFVPHLTSAFWPVPLEEGLQ